MKIKELQEFLDENSTGITIPDAKGDLYTMYFVEATGISSFDWTLCETVEELNELIETLDSLEFDNPEYDIEPSITVRSIGLSQNQYRVFQTFLADWYFFLISGNDRVHAYPFLLVFVLSI